MKKVIVSLVAAAALAVPAGWASVAGAQNPDPDANGDLHSNCHTGSKFRGAGGEDRPKEHGNGEAGGCAAAPVTPVNPVTPGAPAAPGAAGAPSASRVGAAGAPAVAPSGAAVPVPAAPRTTG